MRLDVIFRIAAKLFAPFILLFAFYVQMHGDYGPGGGFQAGVIAAAMIIVYAIIFGLDAAKNIMPPRLGEVMIPAGVLIFAGVGVVSMLLGGNYLDYSALDSHAPEHGQHLGILLVELGVLVTVSGTMVTIFYTFAGRGR
jgi:multicomponent Na+:H+ antiporter subunit B